VGQPLTEDTISAAQAALVHDLSPLGDLHGSAEGKLQWAKVLLARSVRQIGARQ
jgi:CO/xanthine dehydrogenase FAD-binding subunit